MKNVLSTSKTSGLALQALEAKASDLERDILIKGARCKTMQESLQLQEAETLRLQQQLAEASREVGAARTRIAKAERHAHDAQALASRKALEACSQGSAQKTQLLRKVSQAEAAARVCAPVNRFAHQ
jgi:hypothetical protein